MYLIYYADGTLIQSTQKPDSEEFRDDDIASVIVHKEDGFYRLCENGETRKVAILDRRT